MSIWALILFAGVGAATDIVTLPDSTKIQGIREGSVVSYRGIPFAEPPTGNRRWAPPVPWVNPNTSVVLDGTRFGSTCAQLLWGERNDDEPLMAGSEDCLFLNVFVNEKMDTSSPVPVGIFIHGGSYMTGSSSIPLYDGADLVHFWKGRGIIVTTNYRLNVFGFLGSEELRSQDEVSGTTGNYGLQDQRLAMDWVQKNIGAFGGDANNVMIFGESAGGGSVSNHLTMQRSWSYFNSAIIESGSFAQWSTQNMSLAESTYEAVKTAARCENLQCLLALPAEKLFLASRLIPALPSSCGYNQFSPVVDGVELVTHPWIAAAEGSIADVPILHGSNADEGAIFTPLKKTSTESDVVEYWQSLGFSEEEIDKLKELYFTQEYPPTPERATAYWWSAQRSLGDDIMSCPALHLSQSLAALQLSNSRKSGTYLYHFEHNPRQSNYIRHVSELQYVFHQREIVINKDDRDMADLMSSLWGNFLISNNPTSGDISTVEMPTWLPYSSVGDNTLVLLDAESSHEAPGVKKEECDFFIPRIDSLIRQDF